MSRAQEERDHAEVGRLLAGAARTITNAHNCWLATVSEANGPSLRPMGRLPPEPGDDEWTFRFITDGRSHKASDTRRGAKVGLMFQIGAEDAFVALNGAATLIERESEVRRYWKDAYNPFFPTETDRANAAFVEVRAERMELWIRGVTPEPFAMQTTTLERDAAGAWRLIGDAA
ncbi:MAG TPA: pyridoxamine 5'-phosphate oxidase family protein [Roseiarcus sp.]|nr:pyridoxamine 5'-phosphate oxidase family protein [Roseiarcus sp.]